MPLIDTLKEIRYTLIITIGILFIENIYVKIIFWLFVFALIYYRNSYIVYMAVILSFFEGSGSFFIERFDFYIKPLHIVAVFSTIYLLLQYGKKISRYFLEPVFMLSIIFIISGFLPYIYCQPAKSNIRFILNYFSLFYIFLIVSILFSFIEVKEEIIFDLLIASFIIHIAYAIFVIIFDREKLWYRLLFTREYHSTNYLLFLSAMYYYYAFSRNYKKVFFLFLISVFMLFYTKVKMGIVSLLLIILISFIVNMKKKFKINKIIFVVAILFIFIVPLCIDTAVRWDSYLFITHTNSYKDRIRFYSLFFDTMTLTSFICGRGAYGIGTTIHNWFLDILSERGIFGLSSFIGIFLFIIKTGFSLENRHILYTLISFGMISSLLQGLASGHHFVLFHFWVMGAVVYGRYLKNKYNKDI
ncbi:MAG: hypothetical protein AB1765_04675 [Candidatus Hydrogenedentota bacterium]